MSHDVTTSEMAMDTASRDAGHRALCVFVTEQRLREASLGDTGPLSRALPSRGSVKPEWVEFARACAAERIEPPRFIRRVFATSSLDCRPPAPAFILNSPVRETYDSCGKRLRDELAVILGSQRSIINRYIQLRTGGDVPPDEVIRRLALDPFADLHPVIRHRLLKRTGILTRWVPRDPYVLAAVMAYGCTPDLYDEVWGPNWVDDDLKRFGAKLYYRNLKLGDLYEN